MLLRLSDDLIPPLARKFFEFVHCVYGYNPEDDDSSWKSLIELYTDISPTIQQVINHHIEHSLDACNWFFLEHDSVNNFDSEISYDFDNNTLNMESYLYLEFDKWRNYGK